MIRLYRPVATAFKKTLLKLRPQHRPTRDMTRPWATPLDRPPPATCQRARRHRRLPMAMASRGDSAHSGWI